MSALLAVLLVIACATIHYEVLWRLNRVLQRSAISPPRVAVLIAVLGAMLSHVCQIALFALVFYLMPIRSGAPLGGRTGDLGYGEFLYFSMETYTSLGLGDVYPIDTLRLLVGIESITGLLMIGWTATFTYLEMQRFWQAPDRPY